MNAYSLMCLVVVFHQFCPCSVIYCYTAFFFGCVVVCLLIVCWWFFSTLFPAAVFIVAIVIARIYIMSPNVRASFSLVLNSSLSNAKIYSLLWVYAALLSLLVLFVISFRSNCDIVYFSLIIFFSVCCSMLFFLRSLDFR